MQTCLTKHGNQRALPGDASPNRELTGSPQDISKFKVRINLEPSRLDREARCKSSTSLWCSSKAYYRSSVNSPPCSPGIFSSEALRSSARMARLDSGSLYLDLADALECELSERFSPTGPTGIDREFRRLVLNCAPDSTVQASKLARRRQGEKPI